MQRLPMRLAIIAYVGSFRGTSFHNQRVYDCAARAVLDPSEGQILRAFTYVDSMDRCDRPNMPDNGRDSRMRPAPAMRLFSFAIVAVTSLCFSQPTYASCVSKCREIRDDCQSDASNVGYADSVGGNIAEGLALGLSTFGKC